MHFCDGAWSGLRLSASRSHWRLTRSCSAWMTETMKSCQICAGNVPPATGSPRYSVRIGRSPLG